MVDIIQYYYPEGPYGPICDYVAPDTTKRCRIDADCPPGYVCLDGVCVPRSSASTFIADPNTEVLFDPPDNEYAYWPRVTCKKNPITGELYDCQPSWDKPFPKDETIDNPTGPWDDGLLDDFGIYDKFFVVAIGPQSCQPYDPDINIRPVTFVDNDGVKTIKKAVEKSTPVTYPVDASYQIITESSSAITAKFNDDGTQLVVTGRGNGTVTLKFEWDYFALGSPGDGGDGLWWPTGFFSLAPSGGGAGTPGGSYLYLGSQDDAAYYLNYTAGGLNPGGGSSYDRDFLTLDSQEYFSGTPYTTIEYTLSGDPTVYTTTYTSSTTVTLPQNAINIKFIVAGARGGNTTSPFLPASTSRVGGASVLGRFSVNNNDTSQTKTIVLDIPTVGGDGGTLVCCGPRRLPANDPNVPPERVAPPPLGAPGGTGISNGGDGSVGGIAQIIDSDTWYENEGAGGGGAAGVTYNGSLIIVAGGGGGATGISTTGGDGGARNGLPAGFFDAAVTTTGGESASTYGTAVSSITVGGVTFTSSGVSGSIEEIIAVESGQTYPLSFSGLHSVNSPISVVDNGSKLNLFDGIGDDVNATFSVIDIYSPIQNDTSKGSLWSDVADTYGVWVNPKECTLPCLEQEVTYVINFPTTDTYYFECGADNSAEIFLDDETLPFASPTTPTMHNPIIFPGATDPVTISRSITAGNHKVVVRCTNGAGSGSSEESLYIDSSVDWGTISLGSGTAIRDSEVGIPPDDPNSGLNELGGFAVPSDSPTEKYLSFGTLDLTNTPVYTRTASVTLDLTDVSRLVFSVIAGSDTNGGERPNDVSDTWDVSLDGGSTWIQVAPSKQYSGMEFAEYDATYGDWYDFTVNVPENYRVNNATINFRSGGDVPEIGTSYNGLTSTQVETTYANCGDVFGLYRIKKVTFTRGTCNTIHPNAYDWSKNPGGWFIKICQGAPCSKSQTVDWYPVTLGSPWVSLMNDYAVWPSQTEALAGSQKTATYFVTITNSDTYTLKYAGDNEMEIYWDGFQVAQLTGGVSSHYTTIHETYLPNVASGQHTLLMYVNNIPNSSTTGLWSDNPAGIAWTLEDSNGNIVKTSRDLITSGDGNMIWHTRLATGYRYEEN